MLCLINSIYFLPDIKNQLTGMISAIFTISFFFAISIYLFWNQNILRKLKYFSSNTMNGTLEVWKNLDSITEKVHQEMLFKTPGNGLENMATQLEMTKKKLSNLINTKHTSYNAWINEIKINYSISLIENSFLYDYSIETLAKECGFKSKTTFYRAFKARTGKTPSVYLKNYLKEKR